MGWQEINPVIISLISDLLRKPAAYDWNAEWSERSEANRMIHPKQGGALYLKITSCVGVGGGENVREMLTFDNADGVPVTDLYEVNYDIHRFNLQVQAWETEHSDAHWAFETLETLRTRLGWASSLRRLLAVNVDLTDIGTATKISQTINKRRWSIGSMDLTFTAVFSELDPVPVGWIERIVLTSHAQVEGSDMPLPPNVTNDVIPPEDEEP